MLRFQTKVANTKANNAFGAWPLRMTKVDIRSSIELVSPRRSLWEVKWASVLSWGHITYYNLTAFNRPWPNGTATSSSSLTQALDYCLFAIKLVKLGSLFANPTYQPTNVCAYEALVGNLRRGGNLLSQRAATTCSLHMKQLSPDLGVLLMLVHKKRASTFSDNRGHQE